MCAHKYHSVLLIITLSIPFLSPARADTTTALVSHWQFDDGGGAVAVDSVGGHDGRLQGDATWAEGFLGGAVLLDGNGDYVDCGNQAAFNITDAVTLAAWVQARGDFSYPDWSGIIMRGGANIDTFALYYNGTSQQLGFKTTGGTPNWYATGTNSTTALFDGDWHHVAATYDGKIKVVYVDGVAVGSVAATGKIETSTGRLLIGAGRDLTPPTHFVAGRIDEARLYSRALAAADVKELVPPKVQARLPEPASGTMGVQTPLFKWTAGQTAVLHDVYFGKTPDLGPADLVSSRWPSTIFWYAAPLEPGVTYFWRVDEIEADGTTIHTGNVWSFTTQALTAYLPQPADGAVDASPSPTLTWQPGQTTLKHHVYFGDSFEAVQQRAAGTDKGEVTETTFAPGDLEPVTAYYWAVDELVFGDLTRSGSVWTFTTYLPIDDFESYTDAAGEEIFSTWIDGLSDNSNGSTVGHWEAPFAEQTIVHGGAQSMPMDYNNIAAPHFSAAYRAFSPAADWTVNGADCLVLYVRGLTNNKPAQLYLTVDDTANHSGRITPDDATILTTARWNEWKIPMERFTALGVNLAKVKRITIGVDDNPGATGTLYIDDIRAIRTTPVQ